MTALRGLRVLDAARGSEANLSETGSPHAGRAFSGVFQKKRRCGFFYMELKPDGTGAGKNALVAAPAGESGEILALINRSDLLSKGKKKKHDPGIFADCGRSEPNADDRAAVHGQIEKPIETNPVEIGAASIGFVAGDLVTARPADAEAPEKRFCRSYAGRWIIPRICAYAAGGGVDGNHEHYPDPAWSRGKKKRHRNSLLNAGRRNPRIPKTHCNFWGCFRKNARNPSPPASG